MTIRFHRAFEKGYRKLDARDKRKTDGAIETFVATPFAPSLNNHSLTGALEGKRAFSVSRDIRIVYETEDGHVTVLFLDVGSHDRVYR